MNAVRGRVSESSWLSLPSEFRKTVGLEHGDDVVLELADRTIRIRTVDEVSPTPTRSPVGCSATARKPLSRLDLSNRHWHGNAPLRKERA